MTSIDDQPSEIPTQATAQRLGADENEVRSAVKTLLPVLVGGLQHNAGDPDAADRIASAAHSHAASGLLDGGVTPDGRPYFIMERVDGVPLTAYAAAHDLDTDARLGPFEQEAVFRPSW